MAKKRTLPAKEIVADIKTGLTDEELLRKYGLSAKELLSIFDKLVKAGLLSQIERDQRSASPEQTIDLETGGIASEMTLLLWKCPACHMPQPHEFEECPQCGIIVAKFQDKLRASESPDSSRPQEEETSNNPQLSLDRTGPSSSLFDDKRLYGLITAGLLLCLILWAFLPSQNKGISRIQSTEQQPKPSNRPAYTQEQRQTIQDIKDARAREDRLRQRLIQEPDNQVMSFRDPVETTRRAFEEENRRIDMENRIRETSRDATYDELWKQLPSKRQDFVNNCMSRCRSERPIDFWGCYRRCNPDDR